MPKPNFFDIILKENLSIKYLKTIYYSYNFNI